MAVAHSCHPVLDFGGLGDRAGVRLLGAVLRRPGGVAGDLEVTAVTRSVSRDETITWWSVTCCDLQGFVNWLVAGYFGVLSC